MKKWLLGAVALMVGICGLSTWRAEPSIEAVAIAPFISPTLALPKAAPPSPTRWKSTVAVSERPSENNLPRLPAARLVVDSAELPPLEVILLRDSGGKVVERSYSEAIESCRAKGLRLPTVRELAGLAQSRGAKGFVNEPYAEDRETAEFVTRVTATDDGQSIDFFYSNQGYQFKTESRNLPLDYLGNNTWRQGNWFWSSSKSISCPLDGTAKFCAWSLDAGNGKLSDHYETIPLGTLCVKDKK
jgi:hypothetical protein